MSHASLTADGSASTVQASGSIDLYDANLCAVAGGTLDFSSVTSLDHVNLFASGGGTLDFSSATSYLGSDSIFTPNTIRADGGGSSIDLSALVMVDGNGGRELNVEAVSGSTIALAGAVSGLVNITADDSVIDVSGVTSLDHVNLFASGGGTLDFSVATSYLGSDSIFTPNTIRADGGGSSIDLCALTILDGRGGRALNIEAISGGTVLIPDAIATGGVMGALKDYGISGDERLPVLIPLFAVHICAESDHS
ncbi:MAG: hypothetical protein GY903_16995, partial [Fuerstiella sp.]|nr:hypothetical protein [Fuerstiella sp.]